MLQTTKIVLIAALATVVWSPQARAAMQQGAKPKQTHSHAGTPCPAKEATETTLHNGSVLMQRGQYNDAAEVLKPVASAGCDPRASLLLAGALETGGNAAEARGVLERAHAAWPSNNSIAASLAREYLSAHEADKAVEALAQFHATPTTLQQEMEVAVVTYLTAHKLVAAQTVAEAAYKSYPSVHTLLLLANTLQLQGRYPDVNRLLGSKRELYADSPQFLITLAESEYDASIYADARKDIEAAIALDNGSYQAHYILGNVLVRLSDMDRAIQEYHTSIALAPAQPRAYYQLALALRAKQDQAAEESTLEQALAADDHYGPAHCEIGRILLEQNKLEEAVAHLNLATQYNPTSEEAYFLLARAYSKLGEKEKSKDAVKRLSALKNKNLRMRAGRNDDEDTSH